MLATEIATKVDCQLNEIAMPDANPWVPWAICHFLLPYPTSHLENNPPGKRENARDLKTIPALPNLSEHPKTPIRTILTS